MESKQGGNGERDRVIVTTQLSINNYFVHILKLQRQLRIFKSKKKLVDTTSFSAILCYSQRLWAFHDSRNIKSD